MHHLKSWEGKRWRVQTAFLLAGVVPLSLVIAISVSVGREPAQGERAVPKEAFLDTAGHFFLGVAAVLLASHTVGFLATKLGQPRVTGEIAAGILLGPSFLGALAPDATGRLFPESVLPMFNGLAQLGLVLFMFGVGQELGSMRLRGAASQAMVISQASLFVPLAAGVLVALPLVDQYMDHGVRPVAFVLFVGCALSITAFPVLARVLSDLRMSRTRPGQLSLFAAAVGDGGSWLVLAVVLALSHGTDPMSVLGRALAVVAVTVVFVGPLRRLVAQWADRVPGVAGAPAITLFLVAAVGASSALTAALGIHQLIGALLVGLIWPREHRVAIAAVAPLASTAKTILLPFFFLGFGLTVDLRSLHLDGRAGIVLLSLLAAATAAKITGPSLAARLTGLPWRESFTVGVLLNARGLTELVVLQIGYEARLINEELLGLLTIVALATTLMTTPLLRLTGGLPDRLQDPLPLPHDTTASVAEAPVDAVAAKGVGDRLGSASDGASHRAGGST
ncbi:cation:proton antiporter [Streptomyces sp. NPDC087294]|uniref:cation:proton antiporter n=1 Tax=Streptomyces sp. NPDC087294 TaxID=3365777 RepID=UPI0037FD21B5